MKGSETYLKSRIKKGTIQKLKQEVNDIEAKRSRSQAAFGQAILEQKDSSNEAVEFFNRYTAEIEVVRGQLAGI